MFQSPRPLVIDVGLGNIGSVVSALKRQCDHVDRVQDPPGSLASNVWTHAILPGVGSFSRGMALLTESGWRDWILNEWCANDRPFLGICLGMQLLSTEGLEGSSDGKSIAGLGIIPGTVRHFELSPRLPLPHIGWNSLHWNYSPQGLSTNIPNGGDFYFVHSYHFDVDQPSSILAVSDYGGIFTAVVGSGNCFGVQFHPEKSQRLGSQLLSNFLEIV